MLTVVRGVAQMRPHCESPSGDLIRVVLNAASAAEANLALSMTKAVVDRALAAYREIINIR